MFLSDNFYEQSCNVRNARVEAATTHLQSVCFDNQIVALPVKFDS